MRAQYVKYVSIVIVLLLSASAHGLPGEGIMLDPNTGNYTITYFGYDEVSGEQTALRVATFVPATKIDPAIHSYLKSGVGGMVGYSYSVFNGAISRQSIAKVVIDQIGSIVSFEQLSKLNQSVQSNTIAEDFGIASYPMNSPQRWTGRVIAGRMGGLRVSWSSTKNSIPIGGVLNGFGYFSQDLPGVSVAQIRGRAGVRKFADEGPSGEVGNQLDQLVQNDHIPRNVAAPLISVPAPFDPAIVLERIQTHMHTWIAKQLIDTAFSDQLDRYFQVAISTYRLSQPQVGKKHLETMREYIKQQQPDAEKEEGNNPVATPPALIDPLAARVLFFDLDYVMERGSK